MALADELQFKVGLDLSGFQRGLRGAQGQLSRWGVTAARAFAGVASAAAGVGAVVTAIGVSAVKTGAEFESLETQLGTLLGGAEAGAKRMEEIFAFATSTPFELTDLVEAEVNLRALGLAADEVLPLVADFAGAMGVDIPQAAVEVGRAMQFGAGAVETIAGRALRAQVELRTGTDALKMSTEEFREELTKTLTDPDGIFAGGTQKLAATFDGLLSNLSDQWTAFKKDVADAGLFDGVKAALRETLVIINENRAGTQSWAEDIGIGVLASFQMLIQAGGTLVDWATGFKLVWTGIGVLVDEIFLSWLSFAGKMTAAWKFWFEIFDAINPIAAKAVDLLNDADLIFTELGRTAEESATRGAASMVELTNELGAGAEAAERLNTAIDMRNKGTFADIVGPSGGGGAPVSGGVDLSMTAGGGDDAGAALDGVTDDLDDVLSDLDDVGASLDDTLSDLDIFVNRIKAIPMIAATAASQTFGALSSMGRLAADSLSESNAKAARKWMKFAAAAAIFQATIDAAVAIGKGYAQLGPIGGSVAAVGTAAVFAGQVFNAINSAKIPEFDDTPGVMRADGRQMVSLHGEDKFAAAKSTDDLLLQVLALMSSERGSAGGTAPQLPPVSVSYKHLDRQFADDMATGGRIRTSVTRAARQGGRAGQGAM